MRHLLEKIADPEQLGQVPVDGTDGRLRLADVADVVVDHQPLIGDAVVEGEPGLVLVVEKFPGTDARDVTAGVEDALAALAPGLTGMQIETSVFRPSGYIDTAIDNLALVLLIGGMLLLLGLVALRFHWRGVLVAAITVPLSLVTAATALDLLGQGFNALVLAGVAAAAVVMVDEAVVMSDRVVRRLRRRSRVGGDEPVAEIAQLASDDVRTPLVFATAIALLPVLPLAVLGGRPGAFFGSLVLAYSVSVLSALLVAVVVTPALTIALFARWPVAPRSAGRRSGQQVGSRYVGWFGRFAGGRATAPAVTAVLAVLGLAALPFLDVSPVPGFADRNVLVRLDAAPGTSNPSMTEATTDLAGQLGDLAGVAAVGAHVGRAVTGDRVTNVDTADVWVTIGSDADYDGTLAEIERLAAASDEFEAEVVTYTEQKMRDTGALVAGENAAGATGLSLLTGVEEGIGVRVYGQNQEILAQEADKVLAAIASVDGVVDPVVETDPVQQAVEIEVDLDRAQALGVTPGDVRRSEAALLQGIQVGSVFDDQKVFDVIVKGVPSIRESVEDVGNLLIDRPGGGHVTLNQVADVRVAESPAAITREAVSRRLDVTAQVSGRSIEDVTADVRAAVAGLSFPMEYHAEVLERSTADEAGATRVVGFGVAALIALLLLLQAAFRSWRLAAVGAVSIAVSMVGGVLVVLVAGRSLSLGAMLGLLALFALATRFTVLFVCRAQVAATQIAPARAHQGLLLSQPVVRAARQRLSPTVATAVGVALLALPAVVLGGRPGTELLGPMAGVVVGGLVTTALVALFVLPALCLPLVAAAALDRSGQRRDPTAAAEGGRRAHHPAARPLVGAHLGAQRGGGDVTPGPLRGLPVVALALAGTFLVGCSGGEGEVEVYEPSEVQEVEGSDIGIVTFTDIGAAAVGLETEIAQQVGSHTVVDYAALIYDGQGESWVYTVTSELTYQRAAIVVDRIEAGKVLISVRARSGDRGRHHGCRRGLRDRAAHRRIPLTRSSPAALRTLLTPHTNRPFTHQPTLTTQTFEDGATMRRIVSQSLHFRWLVVFVAAGILALGLADIPNTKVDVFPEFAPPRIEIQTIALGNSSNEVEELITVPLEQQLSGIQGLTEIRSKSVSQLSSILLIFDPGTDELRARQLVSERVAQVTATLPTWASPPFMMPALSSTSRILKIGMSSDTVSMIDMSTIAYWKVRSRLLRVDGVAQVAIWGERLPQRHVQVDPELLAQHQVSLQQVMDVGSDALDAGLLRYSDGAVVGTGGFIEGDGQRLSIEHVQPIVDAEDLARVPVVERDGRVLRMEDLGEVLVDSGPLWGDAVINDGPGLMLVVQKYRGANTMEVTRGVEDALAEMQPGLPGIEIDSTLFRPATFIEQSLDNLTRAMFIGILLVILIIIAFLFDWRTAFISLLAIPLSLVAAVLVLDQVGATINVMVLAGLVVAIGVVVDDAIIDVENIVRRLRQARASGSDRSTFSIVLEASVEVRSAITYATAINIIAVVPVLFLEGLSGAFFRPLVLSYALAVLVSMIVALTLTPALCLVMLSRGKLVHRESPLLTVLKRGYHWVLTPIVRRPQPAMALGALVTIAGVLVAPTLGSQLLPNFKERDFLMHWLTQPGTSVTEEYRVSVSACEDLQEIPGVRNCGAHIGQALLADEVYGVDFGENWISVDESVDYDETLASVHRTVEEYPGLYRDVQTYLRERIKEVLTGTSESIVVRIYGPDLQVLRDTAAEVEEAVGDVDGVIDVHASHQTDLAHIEVEPDVEAARLHGLTPGRHPTADLDHDRRRGGQRHLLGRPGVRPVRHVDPVRAAEHHRRREHADRHPGRDDGHAQPGRRRPDGPDAQRDRARGSVPPDRRRGQRERPRPVLRGRGRGGGTGRGVVPDRLPRRGARRVDRAERGEQQAHPARCRGARGHPAAAAGRLRQHAVDRAGLPAPADGPGRGPAGRPVG